MSKEYSINGIEAKPFEFEALFNLLQEVSGRDLQSYTKDKQLSHEELLDILDANRDGKYDFKDHYVPDSLYEGKHFQQIKDGLEHYNFDFEKEAMLHEDDVIQRQQEDATIKYFQQRFPRGSLVKIFIDNEKTPEWPEAITRTKGVMVGRVVGKPNDPPCEDKDLYHREPGDRKRDAQLPVDWGRDNPWGSNGQTNCESVEEIEKASEGDVSYREVERNYLSPQLFGWTPFLNMTMLFPLKKDPIESGEELESGITGRLGMAFHYPKGTDVSPLLLLGAQTLGRQYGTEKKSITRSYSGPLFGTGVSLWGKVGFSLDPIVTISPVFSHEDGQSHLLWGAGIHSTWLGLFGVNVGCEKLESTFMCGGGIGLAIAAQNSSLLDGGW